MSNILLKILDLHTYFFTSEGVVKSVRGIDLTIDRGETLGLVGESGCGKSVTAQSIMRLIPEPPGRIVHGKILFEGQNLVSTSEKEMCAIRGNDLSMIFQEPMTSLNPVLRVGDQIAEVVRLHRKLSQKEAAQFAVDMLAKVELPDPEKRAMVYPHQLSGGMRQRVMIAMALSCDPKMIIADEPTTALDVTVQAQILELMNNLKKDFNAAILLITHDLGVVANMAQRVAIMYAGQIVELADVVDLFNQPLHPYTIGLMASIPNIDSAVPEDKMLPDIPGVVPSLLNLPTGCAFQDRCDHVMEQCMTNAPTLTENGSSHYVRCFLYDR